MTGRVALITGGSRGIGLATAQRFLADGWSVCLTARKHDGLNAAQQVLGEPDRVMTVAGRSDDEKHRRATVGMTLQRFGRLDVLVNNAGINPVLGDLIDLENRAAEKIIDVNLFAPLGWAREMRRALPNGHGGAIVNIASFATVRPSPGLGMYGASKAALIHLTRQLALEFAPTIRVNCVVPALIATEFAGLLFEGRRQEIEQSYPLATLGKPTDVAAAVAFLATEQSSWITGQSLVLDGGLSLTGGIA